MHTSLMVVALAGLFGAEAGQPTWLNDYSAASKQAAAAKKPLAVVLGSGDKGYDKVAREGTLSPEARQALASGYVCVYIDTSTESGKKLAGAFEMATGKGIVISDRTGNIQAFRHEGDLSDDDLVDYLKRYGDPAHVVQRTEGSTSTRSSSYPAEVRPTSFAPQAPATFAPPAAAPIGPSYYPAQGFAPARGGSYCPT